MTSYLILLLLMIFIFALGAFLLKLPIGVAMVLSTMVGTLAAGLGLPLRHFIEGTFGYLNVSLIIAMAMIFMKTIQASGLLHTMARTLIITFSKYPVLLLLSVMFLIMFPGMISGSATAAVLTTGALVAPVLISVGVPVNVTAAIIAMGGIFGMAAPPINVPVMIIGGGIDMPYVGFELPLIFVSVPLAIMVVLLLGYKYLKDFDLEAVRDKLPPSYYRDHGIKIYLPLLLLVFLLVGEKSLPGIIPPLGLPLIFLICSLSALFTGKRFNFLMVSKEAIKDALPILGILMGVGMFIQIITLTGVRGYIVIICLGLPALLFYLGILVGMPLFGAVSSYGSASVMGVPFILALLGQNEVITASALSIIAGLGDLMPPTALAGIFAAQVVGQKNYFKVLKYCILPALLTGLYGIFSIIGANWISSVLRGSFGIWYLILFIILFTLILSTILKLVYRKRGGTT